MENLPINDETFPKIGNYEFLSVLGRGGMGVVCKYRNATLNKLAAVKMLKTKEVSEDVMLRFQREGQAAARLQHPGIVGVHDLGVTEDGDPYMIMDYFEGETLEQLLSRKYQFSLQELETIFLQCAEALQHAHSQGVLHRDIKPSNIMVTNLKGDQLVIKIVDFGIAKILDEDGEFTTTTGVNAGSPQYMSPEQSQGSPIDARADIYSLGCVFYAALAGAPPFSGKNALDLSLQHQKDKPVPISQIPHLRTCPPNIAEAIMRMLEKDPWKRPQTMKEVCAKITNTGTERGKKRRKTNWKVAGTIAAVVTTIILVSLAVYVARLGQHPEANDISKALRLMKNSSKKDVFNMLPEEEIPGGRTLSTLVGLQSRHINVSNQFLYPDDVGKLLNDKKLTELLVSYTHISDDSMPAIGKLTELQLLVMEGNPRITDVGIAELKDLHRLQSITLKETGAGDKGAATLAALPALNRIDFSGTGITDSGVADLCANKRLIMLHLSGTKVTDRAMAMVAKLPLLQELKVGCNEITARGINYLAAAPRLHYISMHGAEKSNSSTIQAIAKLRQLIHFESADGFTDEQARILAENKNWRDVRLDGPMTAQTLSYMGGLPHLRMLHIYGSLKDEDPATIFRRAHPNCELRIDYRPWLKIP